MTCPLEETNENSQCGGGMTPDGLCMAHSILFDYWGCTGGYDLYDSLPRFEARSRFETWHKGLGVSDIEKMKKG